MNPTIRQLSDAVYQLKKQLPYFPQALKIVWGAAGSLSLLWVLLILIQGILPVATVYLIREIVNGIAAVIGTGEGWKGLMPVLPPAVGMVLVLITGEALQGVNRWVKTAQSEKVQDHVHQLIHEKAMDLDMTFYDAPEYYDQLHRARVDALSRPAALIENTGALLQSFITLTAMVGVLLSFGMFIPVLLVLSTIPALFVVLRHTILFHHWRLKNTAAMRKTSYYDIMLTQREAAAEMRLFGLGKHFRSLFTALRNRLRKERVALAKNEAIAHLIAAFIGLASMAGALAWMGLQGVKGVLGLGDMALFYQAFFQGQKMMRSLLSNAGEIYKNIIFLENLFEFLNLNPFISNPEMPVTYPGINHKIGLQNVTFHYIGSEKPALERFNLEIKAGSITAIVGENGAGKTTLIKLLCRFYDPDEGTISIDGIDIHNLLIEDIRNHITVLFQDLVRYHDTVFNNIAFGNINSTPDLMEITASAESAGADAPISRLPKGYETVLGKWFGGAELSAGEWQRLALARAFLRKADFIILDEPTSSMDSWAEADWLQRFRRLVAGKTVLMITHRFTTARLADVIHVMERGKIVESGTHEELLVLKGKYAESWTKQMRI